VWQGCNYDLWRMTHSALWAAYLANLYEAVAIVSGVFADPTDAERMAA
jgi:hypothetical protein